MAIFLGIVIIFNAVPNINTNAADEKQYVVLVLDTAGTTNFMKSETEIAYSAISPISEVKEAGKKFIESVIWHAYCLTMNSKKKRVDKFNYI